MQNHNTAYLTCMASISHLAFMLVILMSKKCSILELQQINVDQCLLMVELAQANYSSMQQHPHHFFSMEGGS